MSISYSVRSLLNPATRPRLRRGTTGDVVLYAAGRLWLDADGACLYDHDAPQSSQLLPLADPEACAALRAALPEPGDYLGDVLLLAHLGHGISGLVLHTVYWIVLGELTQDNTVWRSALQVAIRPAPPGYECGR